jgi:hypothetical protein
MFLYRNLFLHIRLNFITIFFRLLGSWVRLIPLTGLLYSPIIDGYGELSGVRLSRRLRSAQWKRVLVPLCPQQIPCGLIWGRIRAPEVGIQLLTAWVMHSSLRLDTLQLKCSAFFSSSTYVFLTILVIIILKTWWSFPWSTIWNSKYYVDEFTTQSRVLAAITIGFLQTGFQRVGHDEEQ